MAQIDVALGIYSFNPCFDGLPFWTRLFLVSRCALLFGFNPCFDGLPFWTSTKPNNP